ncbi:hypothetical protein ACOSP7_023944 [Xanthoceras sorbifolium]|uniref:Uncharacterized protein n=1 Tax=Xanthoceras sorbifolium TaxID=99658 RepID=A0ABQ8H9H1_9ROSI|nr:hypothetical protein JRO89_XS13G0222200 [Xanthoceras sorbifolium]KAH7550612.1 hypothetical protein JRO89_XS13G0230900 [Xanthoceras sorbifolium]
MKTTPCLALSLSFLFFALFTKPLLSAPEPLLDINGDKVEAGTAYFIVSAIRGGGGGGLSLTFNRNGSCPLDVFQEPLDLLKGYPMFFYPTNYKSGDGGYIYGSTDVNILVYANILNCNQPFVWKVDNFDDKIGAWFITTNGALGNPGPQTLENWFKFERATGDAYKIVHCPSVSESPVLLCGDVGINYDNARRLVLSSQPFRFFFVKAGAIPA